MEKEKKNGVYWLAGGLLIASVIVVLFSSGCSTTHGFFADVEDMAAAGRKATQRSYDNQTQRRFTRTNLEQLKRINEAEAMVAAK